MSDKQLSAVVLAGTHQWGGSHFERLAPRPLVPLALEPLICYSLRWLRDAGVRRATICANGTTRAIEAALGDGAELEMDLSYYRDGTPRGAAGCVRDAVARSASDCFVVTDGSAIPTVDLHKLLEAHRGSGAAATAVVHLERSGSGSPTPGGIYVFERRVLEHVGENGFQDIKENLIPRLHRAGEPVLAFEDPGFCPHVLNAQTYLAVNQWMIQRLAADARDGDAPLVHPQARVERGARLVGPVMLGAGVRVRDGATLVGPTSIGADSTVEADALVACSAIWSGCSIGAAALVHGSVIGHEAVVAPGSRLFNVVRPRLAAAQRPAVLLLDWGRPSQRVTAPPLVGAVHTSCAIV